MTKCQKDFAIMAYEIEAGVRKLDVGESAAVDQSEIPISAHEWGLKYLAFRKQQKEVGEVNKQAYIDHEIAAFEALCAQKKAVLDASTSNVIPLAKNYDPQERVKEVRIRRQSERSKLI
jgi:hypothetical protein